MWRSKFSVPSRLDEFKQFLTGKLHNYENAPEYTDEMFVRRLLKLELPSIHMEVGTMLHSIFEHAQYGIIPHYDKLKFNGWNIIHTDLAEYKIELPKCREVPIKTILGKMPIFGKVDSISATVVRDLKFSSKFDVERYVTSMQWKAYLAMTDLDRFCYDVVIIDINEVDKIITIKDYQKLELYSYENMHQEVQGCLSDYWDLLLELKPLIFDMAKENNIEIKER